ncbi:hypothetical protein GCM10027067_02160 [Pseudactinotalea suaedae]
MKSGSSPPIVPPSASAQNRASLTGSSACTVTAPRVIDVEVLMPGTLEQGTDTVLASVLAASV